MGTGAVNNKMKIGFVILNYNSWNQTYECLESIQKSNISIDYKIYLVDNCSSDEMPNSVLLQISKYDIIYLKTDSNRGFSAGNNVGLKKAIEDKCDYYVISNNDVVLCHGVIEKLIDDFALENDVGIVGPRVNLPDGNMQETHLGCKMTLKGKYLYLLRKTPLRLISKKFVSDYIISEEQIEPRFVYGVSGCFFLIRKECLENVGLLDEGTFLYEEENILSVKMENNHWKTIYDPTVSILHNHGQSTKQKAFAYSCQIESEVYYCKQYLHNSKFLIFPLYLIRVVKYFMKSLVDSEYRSYCRQMLLRTINAFSR